MPSEEEEEGEQMPVGSAGNEQVCTGRHAASAQGMTAVEAPRSSVIVRVEAAQGLGIPRGEEGAAAVVSGEHSPCPAAQEAAAAATAGAVQAVGPVLAPFATASLLLLSRACHSATPWTVQSASRAAADRGRPQQDAQLGKQGPVTVWLKPELQRALATVMGGVPDAAAGSKREAAVAQGMPDRDVTTARTDCVGDAQNLRQKEIGASALTQPGLIQCSCGLYS